MRVEDKRPHVRNKSIIGGKSRREHRLSFIGTICTERQVALDATAIHRSSLIDETHTEGKLRRVNQYTH